MADSRTKTDETQNYLRLFSEDISDYIALDVQKFSSLLVDRALICLACFSPFAIGWSVCRNGNNGWTHLYLLHIVTISVLVTAAVFRKRLSYPMRRNLLMGVILAFVGLELMTLGVWEGETIILSVFTLILALIFGTTTGLIAYLIACLIIIATGLAAGRGFLAYSFGMEQNAAAHMASLNTAIMFILWIPIVTIVLGGVRNHFEIFSRDLHKSGQAYREIFNAVTDAVFIHDIDTGALLEVNQATLDMYGYTRDEMLELSIGDLSSGEVPYTQQHALQNVERTTNYGQLFTWRAKRKNGDFFWVEVMLTKATLGGHERILAVVRDITERKQAEKDLQINIAFLRTLIETLPCLVWLKDQDGVYLACNLKFERFFGAKESQIVGKTDYDFVDKELADYFREKDQAAMVADGPTVNEEQVTYADDGHIERIETVKTPMYDSAGRLIGILGVAHDITERKRTEMEREELIKNLKFKNKEMQDVIYTASHDLRSPLVNIKGFSDELQIDCNHLIKILEPHMDEIDDIEQIRFLLKKNIPKSLNFITTSTIKMANLLSGLLQVSRIGSSKLNTARLDMNKLINNLVASLEHQMKDHGAEVIVDPVPDCIGDINMVDRIFDNLLNNAMKYLDPNRKGEIRISGKIEKDMSVYCVADNGIGINKAHQKKVFEIFHRLDPQGPVEGKGLGLTIVTRMLERLGGTVRLESEPGKGSKFFVSLPTFKL